MTGETPTSWIWADEASGGVKGARLNLAAGLIEWADQPGCGCGDATSTQSFADCRAKGPLESPPAAVWREMRLALSIDNSRARR